MWIDWKSFLQIPKPFKRVNAFSSSKLLINKDTLGIQRAGLFSVDDYQKIQDYNKTVRDFRSIGDYDKAYELTEVLNKYLDSRRNDHHPNLLYKTPVEVLDAIKGTNKVTSPGVVGMVLLLARQTSDYFLYVSMGLGTTPEAIGQKNLQDEQMRVSIETDGSEGARGNVWNHVGTMGYGAISGRYTEFGIHNKPEEPSRMLARSVIEDGVQHDQNDTFVAASHSLIYEIM